MATQRKDNILYEIKDGGVMIQKVTSAEPNFNIDKLNQSQHYLQINN